jgi:Concanavalin A-like lectin/glucanases superfamily
MPTPGTNPSVHFHFSGLTAAAANRKVQTTMKTILRLFCALCALAFCFNPAQAAPAAADESSFQLTIELRDGSRVVGKTVDDAVSLHSGALGDLKLSWGGIRAIEFAANTDTARLTATNGDGISVQFAADSLSLETGFGKTDLPVKQIRSIKVSPPKPNVQVPAVATGEAGFQLTIDLRDGSHVVGKGLDDTLNFHSPAMGDLKLTWAGIRSLEYASASTDTARLTATNGDVYEVQFATAALRVETSFGKTELPVKLIRSLKVSAMTTPGQLPSGLVALWSAEGDGSDSVGDNTATLTDISFADGKVGQAFSFNGTSSSIRIPASPALDVGAGDGFTIMAWIKPTQIDGFHPLFVWTDAVAVNFSIGARPSDSGVLWGCITDGEGNRFVVSHPGVLASGVFQHIAVTFDKASGTGTWYLNGVIVAQRQLSGQVVGTKGDLLISRRDTTQGNWSSNRSFAGLMDEVAIYNRALSAAEVQAIVADQSHGEPLTLPAPSTGWYESWMR